MTPACRHATRPAVASGSAAKLVASLLVGGVAGLGVAACQPDSGGASTPEEVAPPSQAALRAIPLGQPPGEATSAASTIANPFEGDAAAVAQGKALFSSMNCVYCHGAAASGLIGPALNGRGWRYGGAPAQLYNSIHDGRPKGMPAWGALLPPDQIWRLVAYIESLGGASPPATPAMAGLAAAAPSTTGPQVAGQSPTDAAEQAIAQSNQSPAQP